MDNPHRNLFYGGFTSIHRPGVTQGGNVMSKLGICNYIFLFAEEMYLFVSARLKRRRGEGGGEGVVSKDL